MGEGREGLRREARMMRDADGRARAFRRGPAVRDAAVARARAREGHPARYARERHRRPPRRRDEADPRARRGARRLARSDGHRRRAALARRRNAAQRLPDHRGHGVRRAPADALPHDAVVVPPALAIAERNGASGRALISAVAAGLETTVRVGLGTKYPAFRARGWHSPGVIGPFGGAAAAGKLLGLDAERQRNAFGLAGSQSAGTFAQWGTPTIKFHQSRGALSGLLAALLAEQGFTASTRDPRAQGRRPFQCLFRRRRSGSGDRAPRRALGARGRSRCASGRRQARSRRSSPAFSR